LFYAYILNSYNDAYNLNALSEMIRTEYYNVEPLAKLSEAKKVESIYFASND